MVKRSDPIHKKATPTTINVEGAKLQALDVDQSGNLEHSAGLVDARIKLKVRSSRRWLEATICEVDAANTPSWSVIVDPSTKMPSLFAPGTEVDIRLQLDGKACAAFTTRISRLDVRGSVRYRFPVPEQVQVIARRREERVDVAVPCAVINPHSSGVLAAGQTVDISFGGVRAILSATTLRTSTVLVQLPTISVPATVLDISEDGDARLAFSTLTAEQACALAALIYAPAKKRRLFRRRG